MKLLEQMLARQKKLHDAGIRKLYKNSECDVCDTHTEQVKLKGDTIICKKCFGNMKVK
jgi:hypothetical protein